MAANDLLAWFPSPGMASIRLRKVDRWAKAHADFKPYFDTWEAAHSWLQAQALAGLAHHSKRAEQERRHLERVLALTPPAHDSAEAS
jgi:hypothetical protein